MPYSLPVRCSGWLSTSTSRVSRLTVSLPVRITDFGMALGAADDRLDAGDQLAPVEGLGQEVVGAEAQALDLVVELGEAGEDQDRRVDARGAQPAQHLIAVDVRQHQVEDDDVVVVELADLQPVLAEIGGIADEALGASISSMLVATVAELSSTSSTLMATSRR